MLTQAQMIAWLERLAAVLADNKAYLTELDSAIGDADHGINMKRGFDRVLEKLPSMADQDIGTILKSTGMTLIGSVGGASGPLYGTFFMRAATAAGDTETLAPDEIAEVLQAGVDGIVARGRAEPGDKTMVDAWLPALEALRSALADDQPLDAALTAAAAAAEQGMKETIPLRARKGRASYLGERSVGHQDPGATSSYLMLKTLAETIKED
ncbi:MAG: dihydroxyacetone kinase subunit DhaL [Candidatus Promineifilaceae bacterium]|nr:dihydroxyacetone kinase subunit DhaL [Candidatus Promineifilaceae bacterium]